MTTAITVLSNEDKKCILKGFSLQFYKVFHVFFILLFIIVFVITLWQFNSEDVQAVAGLFVWLLLLFNFLFLLDYLFHKVLLIGAKKMIITGKVTDKYESTAEYGGTIVCFDTCTFDITWARKMPDVFIGDTISLHYVNLKNGKRGSLIAIEKC